jgi:hypothetical protein
MTKSLTISMIPFSQECASNKDHILGSHSSPVSRPRKASPLLTLPEKVRVRIYTHLFAGLVLSPAWKHPCAGPLEIQPRMMVLVGRYWPSLGTYAEQGENIPLRDSQRRLDLAILRVCREVYGQASPLLHQCATFRLASWEDHLRFTQPRMVPILARIRSLSISGNSSQDFIGHWSVTLVKLVMPLLSRLEIRDLDPRMDHRHLQVLNSVLLIHQRPPALPSMLSELLLDLLDNSESSKREVIYSHFRRAPDLYDCLILHFAPRCTAAPMSYHEHEIKDVVFAFGKPEIVTQRLAVSTLPQSQWPRSGFVGHSGFWRGRMHAEEVDDPNWEL